MYLPELTEQARQRLMTDTWLGYNHNLRINEGEWYDEENITSSYYPLFAQRGPRGTIAEMDAPAGLLAKDNLLWVDGQDLYYGGVKVNGVTLDTDPDMNPKRMVSMGAYCVIFPDKIYVNTADLTDFGPLDANVQSVEGGTIRYSICMASGEEYPTPIVSPTAPEEPENGDYWIDTSGEVHVLKVYSSASGMWSEIVTVYTKIYSTGIGLQFKENDGVTISGAAYSGDSETIRAQIEAINGDKLVYGAGDDYLIIVNLLDQTYTQTTGQITVKRECPELDHVCECNNRLWGCRYGMQGGRMVNEIYACRLGDFKNWRSYMGTSMDSYAVSVGTDGRFTGCINYQGYPHFFKENCVHKIYGSYPAEYQMLTTLCRGVQEGAERSLQIVNEVLYYKSRADVCAFDGSMPQSISAPLGDQVFSGGVAGSAGGKYYLQMQDAENNSQLYVFDTTRGVWHKETPLNHPIGFDTMRGDLVCLTEDALISLSGHSGTLDTAPVEWFAETGIMAYEYADEKYVSRYNIRCKMGKGAKMRVYFEYDSSGEWEEAGCYIGSDTVRSFTMPVIPRRCDHLRMRISGSGECKIFSVARLLENSSDEFWTD